MIGPQRVDADQDEVSGWRRRRSAGAEDQGQSQPARRARSHATAPRVDSRVHYSRCDGRAADAASEAQLGAAAGLDRRQFLAASAATAAARAAGGLPAGAVAAQSAAAADRRSALSGHRLRQRRPLQTPQLDALARAGTIFDTAYANGLPCAPSRGCLLTGRYRWRRTRGERCAGWAPTSGPCPRASSGPAIARRWSGRCT